MEALAAGSGRVARWLGGEARDAPGIRLGDFQIAAEPIDVALLPIALDQPAHLPEKWASPAVRSERVQGAKGAVAGR